MSLDKADIQRVKEDIRGKEAILEELIKSNTNGENNLAISRLQMEIKNLYRYLYET